MTKRPRRIIRYRGKPIGNHAKFLATRDQGKRAKRAPIETEDGRLNEIAAAEFVGLAVQTLRNRRHRGELPRFLKIGRSVFYERHELEAFNLGRTRNGPIFSDD